MSLQQKLRAFAQLQVGGLIPWENYKFPDTVNSDTSRCVIEGKHGTYRLEVTSSYTAPPLGRVVFTDGDFAIEEVNQDAAWHKIAEHLKAKEKGEEVAVIEEPKPAPVVVPITHNPLGIPDRSFVYYWAEANAWYHNGPALVTRVNRDGSYNLTVFPEGSDPVHRERVGRKSDKLQHVCWEAYPSETPVVTLNHVHGEKLGLEAQMEELRERTNTEIAALRHRIDELESLVSGLASIRSEVTQPQKRGPGRPPTVKVA